MHTPKELEEVATEHLRYELEMLGWTAGWLHARWVRGLFPESPMFLSNAVLESFGVHTRVLADFLMGNGSRRDDVSARHYLPGWAPDLDLGPVVETVNKHMAHLTTRRLIKVPIEITETEAALVRNFGRFVGELEESHRTWFGWFPLAPPTWP